MKSYDTSFKMKVVNYAKENGKRAASKYFKVDKKCVQRWVQSESSLLDMASGKGGKTRKRLAGGGRKVRYEEIDKNLVTWLLERREKGVRVTGKYLRAEALRLHKQNGSQSFKAWNGWYRQFKKRHGITFRRTTHISQKTVDYVDDKIDTFLRFVLRMRQSRNYELRCIGNMDETPIWIEMPGKSTLDVKGASCIKMSSTGHEKERVTVILAGLADGTKLPPFVLLPGVRPLPKADIPYGIHVHMCGSGKKSWADENVIQIWARTIWGRNNMEKRLLVWDTFRGHMTEKVKDVVRKTCNTDMAYIPGGCTSKLQPADVCWNRPFKTHFAEKYDEWFFSGEVSLTKAGNRRPPIKKTHSRVDQVGVEQHHTRADQTLLQKMRDFKCA